MGSDAELAPGPGLGSGNCSGFPKGDNTACRLPVWVRGPRGVRKVDRAQLKALALESARSGFAVYLL